MIAVTVLAFAYVGGWLSPQRLSPARMIAALQEVNGSHPGFRRNHAKGLCVTGYFDSNGAGRQLSKAEVFAPGRVPVVGRFALAGGQPFQPDTARSVRSLALRFSLPDGEEWRTGMNAIPVFPVNTPQAFYEQLLASKPQMLHGQARSWPDGGLSGPASGVGARLRDHRQRAEFIRLCQFAIQQPGYVSFRRCERGYDQRSLGHGAERSVCGGGSH